MLFEAKKAIFELKTNKSSNQQPFVLEEVENPVEKRGNSESSLAQSGNGHPQNANLPAQVLTSLPQSYNAVPSYYQNNQCQNFSHQHVPYQHPYYPHHSYPQNPHPYPHNTQPYPYYPQPPPPATNTNELDPNYAIYAQTLAFTFAKQK